MDVRHLSDAELIALLEKAEGNIEDAPWQWEGLKDGGRIENADGDRQGLWWGTKEDAWAIVMRNGFKRIIELAKKGLNTK